jgi:cysteine desulfurase/selenocysteine lyase
VHTTTEDVDRFLEELGKVRAYFRVDDDTAAASHERGRP